ALRPVRRQLLPHLAKLIVDGAQDAADRRTITKLYGNYAEGLPDAFASLEKEADGAHVPAEDTDERVSTQRHQAIAAVALASLGKWQRAHPLLRHTIDPTARSYLIDRLGPGGANGAALVSLLSADAEISVHRAALLALGEFDGDQLPLSEREGLTKRLAEL